MKQKFKLLITLLILVGTMLPNTILARSFPDSISNIYELRDTGTLEWLSKDFLWPMASGVGKLGYYLGTETQHLPYKVSAKTIDKSCGDTDRDACVDGVDYAVYCTHFGLPSPAKNSYISYCGKYTCTESADSLKYDIPSDCAKDNNWDAGTQAGVAYIINQANGSTFNGNELTTYYNTESTINYFLYKVTDNLTYIQSDSTITGSINKITEYNGKDVDEALSIRDKINNFVNEGNIVTINKPTSTELSMDSNGKRWISSVFTINNFIDKYGTGTINFKRNATIKDEKGNVYEGYAYITNVGGNNYQVGVCNENTGDYCKDISNFTKLSSGNYTVEIDVSGSYNIAQNYSCGTSFQSITPAFTDTVTKTVSDTITFTLNIPDELGTIKIEKVDADSGSTITGATITVKGKDVDYNKTFILKNKSSVTINNLEQGTYEITETKAPNGYEKDEKTYEVVLSKTNLLEEVTISNKAIEEVTGSFTLYKIDENQNKIGGSEFKLYYDDDKTEILEVSKRGFKFTDLNLNEEMCLEETKAPTGYKSNTKKFCFKVLESGEIKLNEDYDFVTVSSKNNVYKVNVINYPEDASIVKIKKVDSKDKSKVLEGAKLHIIDENGKEVVEPWITTTEYYVVTGLTKGKYYVEELEAPEGYTLNSTKLDFVIENDTDDIVLEFINEKPVDVPNTLSNISKALVLLAVSVVLVGSILIYKNKFSEDGIK